MGLGTAAFFVGRYAETVANASRLDPSIRTSTAWWQLTASLHFLGRHERELEEARLALTLNPGFLDYYTREAVALVALGRLAELAELVEEAIAVASGPEVGARNAVNTFLSGTAYELLWHGHEPAGRLILERLADLYRSRAEELDSRNSLEFATTLGLLGQWDEMHQVLAGWRETNVRPPDNRSWILSLGTVGILEALSGNTDEALRYSRLIQVEDGGLGMMGAAYPSHNRARIAAALEECDEATELAVEALRLGMGHQFHHGDLAFRKCRDHAGFQRVLEPRG